MTTTHTPTPEVTRWPRSLPKLTAKNFQHGYWSGLEEANWVDQYDSKFDEKAHSCGTPRCAVGNVISAFRRDCRHDNWDNSPLDQQVREGKGPVAKFIKRFAEHLGAGEPITTFMQLSDLFEREKYSGGYGRKKVVTAKKAADAWNKTIEDFGYTEAL